MCNHCVLAGRYSLETCPIAKRDCDRRPDSRQQWCTNCGRSFDAEHVAAEWAAGHAITCEHCNPNLRKSKHKRLFSINDLKGRTLSEMLTSEDETLRELGLVITRLKDKASCKK